MPTIQDFSLINEQVLKYKNEYELKDASNAFYFLVLDALLDLQPDEIENSITDNFYLRKLEERGRAEGVSGHDRGIDAVYVDTSSDVAVVHFMNCKYTEKFEKLENWFPGTEIDKIAGFLKELFSKDKNLKSTINAILASKVDEIWRLFEEQNPNFIFHICTNSYNGFMEGDRLRFERENNRYSNFRFEYQLMPHWVDLLTRKSKTKINARLRAIDTHFFDKSDGDIRALIGEIDARDLVRIVLDDETIRNRVELEEYSELKRYTILEDAFEDNVRVYLKQKTTVNQNIKLTALSDDNNRFFYFNNGVTITCSRFSFPKNQRAPIITLENLQIVNGSQTIHALHEALHEDSSKFGNIEILVRIYETDNLELKTKIAEYTNSQNPVKSRDVRSIDFRQLRLQKEFGAKGLFYERKKREFANEPRKVRIDAEKTGQVLYAFYNKMPAEAKNKKREIFDEKHYDEIFDEQVTANRVLLPYRLFERLEEQKRKTIRGLVENPNAHDKDAFLLHASYYMLYSLGKIAELKSTPLTYENLDVIWGYYPEAQRIMREVVAKARKGSKNYSHGSFFKTNEAKRLLDDQLAAELG